jgi:hypothetical protein
VKREIPPFCNPLSPVQALFLIGFCQVRPTIEDVGDDEINNMVMGILMRECPEPGTAAGVITGVDIQRGWGDVVYVDIFYSRERGCGMCSVPNHMRTVQSEISRALGRSRHSVRLVEAA